MTANQVTLPIIITGKGNDMHDNLIKQEKLVHNLFLRHLYDKKNPAKLEDYEQAKRDLVTMKYAETK